ncbi:MAG: terminase large subunit domain-containing protein, partial [Sphingopyxis sp.]
MRQLAGLRDEDIRQVLRDLSRAQMRELERRWYGFENDGQRAPPGDWRIWLIRAGRGFGKTRAGSEWVSEVARSNGDARIALVAATQVDGQRVMIEGPSGLLAVARHGEEPRWVKGKRELRFSSGAVATLYSAEAGEELRGPEH